MNLSSIIQYVIKNGLRNPKLSKYMYWVAVIVLAVDVPLRPVLAKYGITYPQVNEAEILAYMGAMKVQEYISTEE